MYVRARVREREREQEGQKVKEGEIWTEWGEKEGENVSFIYDMCKIEFFLPLKMETFAHTL